MVLRLCRILSICHKGYFIMQKKTLKLAIIGAVIFVLTVMCTAVAVRHMVLTEVRSAETADLTKPEEVLAVVEEENEPVIDKSFQEDPEWQAENERLLNEQAQENGDDWIRIQLHRQGNIAIAEFTAKQSGLVVNEIRINDDTCGMDQGGYLVMDGGFRIPKTFGNEMKIGESNRAAVRGNNCRFGNIFNATIYTNKGNWTTTFQ